jgi:hypothetical protein
VRRVAVPRIPPKALMARILLRVLQLYSTSLFNALASDDKQVTSVLQREAHFIGKKNAQGFHRSDDAPPVFYADPQKVKSTLTHSEPTLGLKTRDSFLLHAARNVIQKRREMEE